MTWRQQHNFQNPYPVRQAERFLRALAEKPWQTSPELYLSTGLSDNAVKCVVQRLLRQGKTQRRENAEYDPWLRRWQVRSADMPARRRRCRWEYAITKTGRAELARLVSEREAREAAVFS